MRNKIERKCPVCSIKYLADKTRLKFGRETTCSRKCSYVLRGAGLNKTKKYFCAVCGKTVLRPPSQVKSTFIFCSSKCHYEGRSLGLVKRVISKPYKITPEGRESWKKAGEKRKGFLYKDPISWTCEICGKKCTISRGNFSPARKLRFCSHECANKGLTGENNPSWRGGHPNYYGPDWRPLQRQARKLDNHHCQRCNISQRKCERNLDVHHIKPVSAFKNSNDSNYIKNVISLCHYCHMLVEWNGIDFDLPNRFKNI